MHQTDMLTDLACCSWNKGQRQNRTEQPRPPQSGSKHQINRTSIDRTEQKTIMCVCIDSYLLLNITSIRKVLCQWRPCIYYTLYSILSFSSSHHCPLDFCTCIYNVQQSYVSVDLLYGLCDTEIQGPYRLNMLSTASDIYRT